MSELFQRKWLFRVASLPCYGGGHIARSLQLAKKMRARVKIDFLLDPASEKWTSILEEEGFKCFGEYDQITQKYSNIWIDHYQPEMANLELLGAPTSGIVDEPDIQKGYNFVLSYLTHKSVSISGLKYALIDPCYARVKNKPAPILRHTLCFGQTDSKQSTMKVLDALECCPDILHLNVICGETNQDKERIMAFKISSKHRVSIVCAPNNLKEVFAVTDIFITSGGVSVLEACAAGVPCLVISTARNQVLQTRELERQKAVLYCGPIDELASERLLDMVRQLRTSTVRIGMSGRAKAVIDGHGAQRVCDAILAWS